MIIISLYIFVIVREVGCSLASTDVTLDNVFHQYLATAAAVPPNNTATANDYQQYGNSCYSTRHTEHQSCHTSAPSTAVVTNVIEITTLSQHHD